MAPVATPAAPPSGKLPGIMPQYLNTVELRQMPASVAVARIFKFSVIHQTPRADAVLKRHAMMILSGYLDAAMIKAGKPTRDTALIDLICKLLAVAVEDQERSARILRKLFKTTRSDDLQINRLIRTCHPEMKLHDNYGKSKVSFKDHEEDGIVEVINERKENTKVKERAYKTPEEEEAALRSGEWGKRKDRF